MDNERKELTDAELEAVVGGKQGKDGAPGKPGAQGKPGKPGVPGKPGGSLLKPKKGP